MEFPKQIKGHDVGRLSKDGSLVWGFPVTRGEAPIVIFLKSDIDAWYKWLKKEVVKIQTKRRKWSVSPIETTGDMLQLMDKLEIALRAETSKSQQQAAPRGHKKPARGPLRN